LARLLPQCCPALINYAETKAAPAGVSAPTRALMTTGLDQEMTSVYTTRWT
jgi:hypothetical protein